MGNREKSKIGLVSLWVAIGGMTLTQLCLYMGWLHGPFWHVVLAGFEAATVGGVADWFAVSALFKEIPIPLVRRHTNIIVKNRAKLTEGVVDLVTNKWLAPDIIKGKIEDVPLSAGMIGVLDNPANKSRAMEFIGDFLRKFAQNLDKPEFARLLHSVLKGQLKGLEVAPQLGKWLKDMVHKEQHVQLWEILLNSAEKTLHGDSTQEALAQLVKKQIKSYKSENFKKKLFLGFVELMGAIDQKSIVGKITASITGLIHDIRGNSSHPMRSKLDHSILAFAQGLCDGKKDQVQWVENIKNRLIDNADAHPLIQGILTRFKQTVDDQLSRNDTPFMNVLQQNADTLIEELKGDKEAQQNIDHWLKESISELIGKYHHEIGNMVRLSLTKLQDIELVGQLEEKVGNDLQYIRLNGAVVGGLVGMVIAVVRILVL
jgi:uncharacterized membrane-anchored protein YjiN (DUF445 family)